VPYFRNVAADLVDVLEANNAAKSMLANGDADATDHVALLNFSLEALHKCFLYDVKSDVSKVCLLRIAYWPKYGYFSVIFVLWEMCDDGLTQSNKASVQTRVSSIAAQCTVRLACC
jgi:hypothetical protein